MKGMCELTTVVQKCASRCAWIPQEIKRSTCVHSSNGSKAPSYLCSATFNALSGHFSEVLLVPAVKSQQSAQFGEQDAGTCTDPRARTGYQGYFPLEGRHLKHTFKGRCCQLHKHNSAAISTHFKCIAWSHGVRHGEQRTSPKFGWNEVRETNKYLQPSRPGVCEPLLALHVRHI